MSPEPAKQDSIAVVDVNLSSSQTSRGVTVARVCSEDRVVFKGLGNLTTPLQIKVDRDFKLA